MGRPAAIGADLHLIVDLAGPLAGHPGTAWWLRRALGDVDHSIAPTFNPPVMALVVLGVARLAMDHREARLLNAAHASVMGWEQIAAILDLSVNENRGTVPAAQTPPGCAGRRNPPTATRRHRCSEQTRQGAALGELVAGRRPPAGRGRGRGMGERPETALAWLSI
jgi:hypothetical protein